MIKAKHDGQYKQVGFIKVRQSDGTYKDVEKKYGKTNTGEYGLVFEKGFTREKSGALPLQLDGIGKPLKDYTIYGNTYQSDGVSPDTPQEVVGCGDRTGNLFSSKWEQGTITTSGDNATAGTSIRTADYIPITPNLIYSFERSVYSGYINLRLYDRDKKFLAIGTKDTIELITGNSVSNPMIAGQSFCCFKVILADAAFIRFSDLSKDLSTRYMMVEGEHTHATMPNYEPYGYKIPMECRGKNLFKAPKYTSQTVRGVTWESNGDGTITVSGIASGYSAFNLADAYPIPSDCVGQNLTFNYRISSASNIAWAEITFFDENYTEVGKYATGQKGAVTIKIEQNFKKVTATIKRHSNIETTGTVGLMIETGSTATEYEPYVEPITTPLYLDKPLYKIGDYSDSRGMTEEVRAVKELVLTGTENYKILSESNAYGIITFFIEQTHFTPTDLPFGWCSHFPESNETYQTVKNESFGLINKDRIYIRVSNNRIKTKEELAQWIKDQYEAGTPVKVYYVLAEPETETVELPEIPTLDGTTVIDVETEVEPSNVYLKYKSNK